MLYVQTAAAQHDFVKHSSAPSASSACIPRLLPCVGENALQQCGVSSSTGQGCDAQVLSALAPADLLWVAAVPGISEEFFFRGALIPATFPDWCGP